MKRPLKSWTAITAKINWNNIYTMRMLNTFLNEVTTQSNTAYRKRKLDKKKYFKNRKLDKKKYFKNRKLDKKKVFQK